MTTQQKTGDRVAAALEALKKVAPKGNKYEALEKETTPAPKQTAVADMSNNPVARIWNDTHLSNAQKVEATVDYLTSADGDYARVRAHFLEFKAYFASEQQNGVQADIDSMEALISEVKDATKPMVDGIVHDLKDVQKAVETTGKLLSVIRRARLDGTTIEAIGAAFDRNEDLLSRLATLGEKKPGLETDKGRAQTRLDNALSEEQASRAGFMNSLYRKVAGADPELTAAIDFAQERLASAESSIKKNAEDTQRLEGERLADLEDGPLTILRTLDRTSDSFSENLVKQAEMGIRLLRGIAGSIGSLITRTDTGENDVRALVKKTIAVSSRDELLQGVLKKVAEKTKAQSETYSQALTAKDVQIAAETDQIKLALLKSDRGNDVEKRDGALDYEAALQTMVNSFSSIMSHNVESRGRAENNLTLIQAQKTLFERLAQESMPATSTALYTVLTEARALQIGEEGMAVSAVTESARKLGKDGLASVMQTQREMHHAGVEHTEATIKALQDAHVAMADQIERAVEEGLENRNLGQRLEAVAGELRQTTETFAQVRATVSDLSGGKGDAVNQNEPDDGPQHPAAGSGTPRGALSYPQVA